MKVITKEEIHNIYLHMQGKAEGLTEAGAEADFPVMFARTLLEYVLDAQQYLDIKIA